MALENGRVIIVWVNYVPDRKHVSLLLQCVGGICSATDVKDARDLLPLVIIVLVAVLLTSAFILFVCVSR